MPHKWTFKILPVKKLLKVEAPHDQYWLDPFAGKYSPAKIKNDINHDMPTGYHEDALEFVKRQPDNHYDGVLFDPPYSEHEIKRHYNKSPHSKLFNRTWMSELKDNIARIIKPGGKVICCGWNSNGIGKNRGFKMTRMLIIYHGTMHNDTIVTIEIKKTVISTPLAHLEPKDDLTQLIEDTDMKEILAGLVKNDHYIGTKKALITTTAYQIEQYLKKVDRTEFISRISEILTYTLKTQMKGFMTEKHLRVTLDKKYKIPHRRLNALRKNIK